MNQHHNLWHLFWFFPFALLYLTWNQANVYYGLTQTYNIGDTYIAEVVDFEIKQIAAQTNGHLTVEFETIGGEQIRQQLSQPIQNAAQLQDLSSVSINYLENSYQPIVLVPIYEFHRNMVVANFFIALFGFTVTGWLAYRASKYAYRKTREGSDDYTFELIEDE